MVFRGMVFRGMVFRGMVFRGMVFRGMVFRGTIVRGTNIEPFQPWWPTSPLGVKLRMALWLSKSPFHNLVIYGIFRERRIN
jgi:hypothetical protein